MKQGIHDLCYQVHQTRSNWVCFFVFGKLEVSKNVGGNLGENLKAFRLGNDPLQGIWYGPDFEKLLWGQF